MRKFLNKNINVITEICYPEEVTLDKFSKKVIKALPNFVQNMKILGTTKERYPEEWMELFLDWYEIIQD